jgi:hypothetical protein
MISILYNLGEYVNYFMTLTFLVLKICAITIITKKRYLAGLLAHSIAGRLARSMIGRLAGSLYGWLAGLLYDWLAGSVYGWLAGWGALRLAGSLSR